MNPFRRDKLRRLIEAGKVETVSTYSFDDMTGESRGNKPMRAAIMPADWRDCHPGICYIRDSEFKTKSGACWERDGIITLIVHSNSNYDFRVLP